MLRLTWQKGLYALSGAQMDIDRIHRSVVELWFKNSSIRINIGGHKKYYHNQPIALRPKETRELIRPANTTLFEELQTDPQKSGTLIQRAQTWKAQLDVLKICNGKTWLKMLVIMVKEKDEGQTFIYFCLIFCLLNF